MGLVVLLLFGWVHIQAGITLPNPWSDEAWTGWQGHAFAETGTFLAPELNPDRPTFAYGGGYAAGLGTFFKLFGTSMENGRWYSWLCMTVVWITTLAMLRRLQGGLMVVPIVAWFFLSTTHVVAGNMMRTEAMTLMVVTLGFFSADGGYADQSHLSVRPGSDCSPEWCLLFGGGCCRVRMSP